MDLLAFHFGQGASLGLLEERPAFAAHAGENGPGDMGSSRKMLDGQDWSVYLSSMKYADAARAIKGLGAISIPLVTNESTAPSLRKCQFEEQVDHMGKVLGDLEQTVGGLEKVLAGVLRESPGEPSKECVPETTLVPAANTIRTFVKRIITVGDRIGSIRDRLEV